MSFANLQKLKEVFPDALCSIEWRDGSYTDEFRLIIRVGDFWLGRSVNHKEIERTDAIFERMIRDIQSKIGEKSNGTTN